MVYSEIWQKAKLTADYGYTKVIYDGRSEMKNWKALELTDKGKVLLGRKS